METKKRNIANHESLNHPGETEWMGYLYGELPSIEKGKLENHLEICPACSTSVEGWRATMKSLDTFAVPGRKRTQPRSKPAWGWAAAAAAIIILSFALGRASSGNRRELTNLRTAFEQLNQKIAEERKETVALVREQTREDLGRFFAEYSSGQHEQRQQDRTALNLALATLHRKVGRVESELETVAVNTQTSFQQTQDNLKRVASISIANNETLRNEHN